MHLIQGTTTGLSPLLHHTITVSLTLSRTGRERERGERDYYRTHASNASSATLAQSVPRHSSGSGSSAHHRSKSQPRSEHRRPHTSRSVSTYEKPVRASYDQPPVRSATLPAQYPHPAQPQYTSAPGQPVVVKDGRRAYVVVPPHGGRVEVRVRVFIPLIADPEYSLSFSSPYPIHSSVATPKLHPPPHLRFS